MIAYRFVSIPAHLTVGTVVPRRGKSRPAMFFTPRQAHDIATSRMTIAKIQSAVAIYYGIPAEHMRSRSRDRSHVYPRQMAMLLARELTKASLPGIAHHFAKKDHTTVIHAIERARQRIAADPNTEIEYATLRAKLAA